jgi:hypothetical protein
VGSSGATPPQSCLKRVTRHQRDQRSHTRENDPEHIIEADEFRQEDDVEVLQEVRGRDYQEEVGVQPRARPRAERDHRVRGRGHEDAAQAGVGDEHHQAVQLADLGRPPDYEEQDHVQGHQYSDHIAVTDLQEQQIP